LIVYAIGASSESEMDNPKYGKDAEVDCAGCYKFIGKNKIHRDAYAKDIGDGRPKKSSVPECPFALFKEVINTASFKGNGTFFAVVDAVFTGTCK